MKRFGFCLTACLLLTTVGTYSLAHAEDHTNHPADMEHHKHKMEWDAGEKEKVEELIKLGYSKHDIFVAMKLSKEAKVEAQEILAFHQNSKSWQQTATHFGVDPTKIKHHHDWKKHHLYLEKNKEKVMPYLATYLGKEEAELNGYLEEGAKLHTLVKASIVSKLAGVELKEVLKKKEDGQSFRDIAKEYKLEKQDLMMEMKKLKDAIEK
ncbi:hypothetical protein JOC95_002705 [Bacillus tianshenii]|uniref:Uncharacterized protein n=1 Tax=Sutcliffiella tianshenii TaxID=1463404 RepID=A0ABS2P1Q1_9BACI|nr:hypothetical protein [Bacillus tianshenii]MBM7620850.1 hypothetical protein [Bacillus tianshenii]